MIEGCIVFNRRASSMSAPKYYVWLLSVVLAIHQTAAFVNARIDTVENKTVDEAVSHQKTQSECKIEITEHMKIFFPSQLALKKPHFVQFKIKPNTNKHHTTNDVFKPLYWFWTFAESSEPYPFLSWNLDYGVLSFHLLDAKTIHIKDVYLDVSESCNLTYGTTETTKLIVEAMIPLVNVNKSDYPTYPESYFCYYHLSQITQDFSALHYQASLYFIFPISSIGFKCSVVYWKYAQKVYNVTNQTLATHLTGYHKWGALTLFPYLLGTAILLFFPTVLFTFAAWMSEDENVYHETAVRELIDVPFENENLGDSDDDKWFFADGNSPLGLSSVLSFHICGLNENFPVLVSRLRRVCFVLSAPMMIYLQSAMYLQGMGLWNDGDKITIKDLVTAGAPMGFLSIFGDKRDRHTNFVPLLGGPVGVVILYYTVGMLFIALPRSFKQVAEDGIPSTGIVCNSPLLYDFRKIISLSMVDIRPHQLAAGYTKACTMLKCSFYCLFTSTFWKSVWDVQTARFEFVRRLSPLCKCLSYCILLPVYILLCLTEILLCIIFYGLPFCGFVVIIVKGATRAVGYLGQQNRFMRYRIIFIFVFCLFIVFAYIISLLFIKSFVFAIQVLTYTFVAVIVYPSVAFGYIFFVIVLLYYFIKLVRNFGNQYEDLLTTAVELSRHLEEDCNLVHTSNGQLNISNVNAKGIKDIRINGKQLDVSSNVLQTLKDHCSRKLKRKDDVYGIPKELFNILVRKHKPIHVQLLSLCFKAMLVIAFVAITFNVIGNYATGPSSEISEVMHVIFIVAIGAVPKLVEAVISQSNSVLVREIEERRIQTSIVEYWNNIGN